MDLLVRFSSKAISFPSSQSDWKKVSVTGFSSTGFSLFIQISQGFELCCGFPDVVGAIDGSLLEIERPYEYDGYVNIKRM